MGGIGSGWYKVARRAIVEDTPKFCVVDVRPVITGDGPIAQFMRWPCGVSVYVTLDDNSGNLSVAVRFDEGERGVHQIRLFKQPCNFGGYRHYFECPRGCGRKVTSLYLAEDDCACRGCLALSYTTQLEDQPDRAFRQAVRARQGLGGSSSIMEPLPSKPKGMHWKTYRKLLDKAKIGERIYLEGLERKFRPYQSPPTSIYS